MKTVTLLLLAGVALAACSGSSAPARPAEITVEAKEFAFSPAVIEVTAGQPVKLTFRNTGALEHDFSVMEFPMAGTSAATEPMGGHDMGNMTAEPELHVAAMTGQTSALEFTPSQPGRYEFLCTVSGHKQAGMVGSLVVESP